jgi:hypothetical protein
MASAVSVSIDNAWVTDTVRGHLDISFSNPSGDEVCWEVYWGDGGYDGLNCGGDGPVSNVTHDYGGDGDYDVSVGACDASCDTAYASFSISGGGSGPGVCSQGSPLKQCNDCADNDGDNKIDDTDYADSNKDPDCDYPEDNYEPTTITPYVDIFIRTNISDPPGWNIVSPTGCGGGGDAQLQNGDFGYTGSVIEGGQTFYEWKNEGGLCGTGGYTLGVGDHPVYGGATFTTPWNDSTVWYDGYDNQLHFTFEYDTSAGNNLPVGSFDSVVNNQAQGWTFDPDGPNVNLQYVAYISTNAANTDPGPGCGGTCGNYPGNYTNLVRADVDAAYALTPGTRGFSYTIPEAYRDAGLHYINIYAIDTNTGQAAKLAPTRSFILDQKPIGSFDGILPIGRIDGWTFDPDTKNTNIDYHVYISNDAGCAVNCTGYANNTTNISRADVDAAYGISPAGNHGFNFTIPAAWYDGIIHYARVYGINSDPSGGGNTELIGSPRSFTMPAPTGTITNISSPRATILTSDGYPLGTIHGTATDVNSVTALWVVIRRGDQSVCSDWNGSAWAPIGDCTAVVPTFTPGASIEWTLAAPPANQMLAGSYTIYLDVINAHGQQSNWVPNTTVVYTGNPNANPVVSNVRVTEPNYCASAPSAFVEWTYSDADGDAQGVYRVQIDDDPSFNSPLIDTGDISCSACRSYLSPATLAFNTTYRARVATLDARGGPSGWQAMSLCTGPGCQGGGNQWTTPAHAYPSGVDFTWTPPNPAANQVVSFTGSGTCYANGNVPAACSAWNYAFGDGGTAAIQNPTHAYAAEGSYNATLQVVDAQGFTCPLTPAGHTINAQKKIPTWKEVAPK